MSRQARRRHARSLGETTQVGTRCVNEMAARSWQAEEIRAFPYSLCLFRLSEPHEQSICYRCFPLT
jgi:hypothetical protein